MHLEAAYRKAMVDEIPPGKWVSGHGPMNDVLSIVGWIGCAHHFRQ